MKKQYHEVLNIPIAEIRLQGELIIPEQSKAIIIFSHGSGSSRMSKRNQYVARHLKEYGFGTLLFDLLTSEEDQDYENRFDIDLNQKACLKLNCVKRLDIVEGATHLFEEEGKLEQVAELAANWFIDHCLP